MGAAEITSRFEPHVAGAGILVCRVKDVKATATNAKGPGHTFVMVDAGFTDLLRPAMYGSYHHISIVYRSGRAPNSAPAQARRIGSRSPMPRIAPTGRLTA